MGNNCVFLSETVIRSNLFEIQKKMILNSFMRPLKSDTPMCDFLNSTKDTSSSRWKGHQVKMVLKCQQAPGPQRFLGFGECPWNLIHQLVSRALAVPIQDHLRQIPPPVFLVMDRRVAAQGLKWGQHLQTSARKWCLWSLTLPKEGWREQDPIC